MLDSSCCLKGHLYHPHLLLQIIISFIILKIYFLRFLIDMLYFCPLHFSVFTTSPTQHYYKADGCSTDPLMRLVVSFNPFLVEARFSHQTTRVTIKMLACTTSLSVCTPLSFPPNPSPSTLCMTSAINISLGRRSHDFHCSTTPSSWSLTRLKPWPRAQSHDRRRGQTGP